MSDEPILRAHARNVVLTGVPRDEMEFELDKVHVHIRGFAAWEFERRAKP